MRSEGTAHKMNIGQILELHMGMAAKKLNVHIATPVLDGAKKDDVAAILEEAGMDPDGKTVLYNDGVLVHYMNCVTLPALLTSN